MMGAVFGIGQVLWEICRALVSGSTGSSREGWEIFKVSVDKSGLTLDVGFITVGIIVVAAMGLAAWKIAGKRRLDGWEVVKATLKVGNIGHVEIQPNRETVRVAYEVWVELMTRKAGLAFDEENDVIVEVYDSWYELFGVLRDLAKTVPAHRLRESESTRLLVDMMLRVMNDGLRPHLTKWQARFRRWYDGAQRGEDDEKKTPQQIQCLYPEYRQLVDELKIVNSGIVEWADWLARLSGVGHV